MSLKLAKKSSRSPNRFKHVAGSRTGFNKVVPVSRKIINFMRLDFLQSGSQVSHAFVTKFFTSYIQLTCPPHEEGLKYINLSPVLIELFSDAIIDRGLDVNHFTYVDLQKILCYNFKREVIERDGPIDVRYRQGNFDIIDEFVSAIREELSEYRIEDRSMEKDFRGGIIDQEIREARKLANGLRLKNIKAKWMAFGLTSLYMQIPDLDEIVDVAIQLKVYGGDDDPECAICMDEDKDSVFRPCGHYACCSECARMINECCICRSPILSVEPYIKQ